MVPGPGKKKPEKKEEKCGNLLPGRESGERNGSPHITRKDIEFGNTKKREKEKVQSRKERKKPLLVTHGEGGKRGRISGKGSNFPLLVINRPTIKRGEKNVQKEKAPSIWVPTKKESA